jgi:hypothetical protein
MVRSQRIENRISMRVGGELEIGEERMGGGRIGRIPKGASKA